jgi:hypothetical protein
MNGDELKILQLKYENKKPIGLLQLQVFSVIQTVNNHPTMSFL